jgi:branched-chain amino acid transport system permease protein
MSLVLLPNILVNTLVLASMYILASLGFAFVFNMLGTMNLAHGTLYMIAAYICYYLSEKLGMSNWLAMLCSTVILIVLGIALERIAFRPFYDNFNRVIMISVALMTIMQTTSILISGAKTQKIPSYAEGTTNLGVVTVSNEKLVTFMIGLLLLVITLYIVNRTKLGMQMEAVAQDRTGASLQGIPINKVSSFVFALGCALAAISGCLMGAYQQLTPFMGDNMQTRILMLVMLAGAGSMNGIIITGTIMAFLDSLFPVLFQSYTASAMSVSLIIVLLLIRPKGFFGHEMA